MTGFGELTTPIDRASKLLFKAYADVLLRLAFPGQAVRLVSIEENVELNLPTRPVDMVMIIASGEAAEEEEKGLHVEYYAQYKTDIPQKLFIYSGELTDKLQMQVATVAIYSERRSREQRPPAEYVVQVGNLIVNRFTYPDVWLMDYEGQIRSGELAPLAPFLLEIVPRPTAETVQTAKALVLAEPEVERRGLLLSLVALLAGRYFDKATIRQMFRQEVSMIRTNTFIDDWLEEAEQRGLQQGEQKGIETGLQKGELLAHRRLLLHLLEHRFGALPAPLASRLEALTVEQLNRLVDLALDATSLHEFTQALEAMTET